MDMLLFAEIYLVKHYFEFMYVLKLGGREQLAV